jgi:predicted transcriptional regulator
LSSNISVVVEPKSRENQRILHILSMHLGYLSSEQISKHAGNNTAEVERQVNELVSKGFAKKSNNSYKIALKGELAIASIFHTSIIIIAGVIALLSAVLSLSPISVGGTLLAFSASLFGYVYLMFKSRRALEE